MLGQQLDIFETPQPAKTWKTVLHGEKECAYFQELMQFLQEERKQGKIIYPPVADIFNALTYTPFEDVKVVIIGQDPYHGPNQAHGLCFSVRPEVPLPPSLHNIFEELSKDLGIAKPKSGCLEKWAKQGVLLLNALLTVEAGKPQSHSNRGWERFTDRIIKELNDQTTGLVFLLWGAYALQKAKVVDTSRHHILSSPHPSPFSAHKGFFGSRPFSKANEILKNLGKKPIDWAL